MLGTAGVPPLIPHSALSGTAFLLGSGKFSSQALLGDISVTRGKHFHTEAECSLIYVALLQLQVNSTHLGDGEGHQES